MLGLNSSHDLRLPAPAFLPLRLSLPGGFRSRAWQMILPLLGQPILTSQDVVVLQILGDVKAVAMRAARREVLPNRERFRIRFLLLHLSGEPDDT